ncbi:MAG: MauE/DoxX family redox-associated membrane protein [Gammaproteobacteria bacterium]|nr:MauE/DoxX family redox-associated membrane protein [Gammaproteobacteria bacterium]
MIDPAFQALISIACSILFFLAGAHKLSDRAQFQSIVGDYRLLPPSAIKVFAIGIGFTEVCLGTGWLIAQTPIVPLLSALIISLYVIAISVNLFRGRVYIDCGCSFSSFAGSKDSINQRLSFGLVVRNFALIVVMLISILPPSERALEIVDYVNVFIAMISILFVYLATNQLLINRGAIDSWRRPSG